MNKLEFYRTHMIINDYNIGDCVKLEDCFRVYDPITHSYYCNGMDYNKETKQLRVPRGIDTFFVENLTQTRGVDRSDVFDDFGTFKPLGLKYMPRDDKQVETLQFMCGEGKYHRNKYLPQLSVNLATGKGKTYCSVATASYFGIRTIIITYSTKWLTQWKDCIIEYTNISKDRICMINGSSKIKRLMNNGCDYDFLLVTHSTLTSYAKNNGGYESIGQLFKELKIGIKMYDEAHLCTESMYMIDFYTYTFKTYYITATPMRSNENENMIYQYYMKNVPKIDLFDENEDPHTHYIAIKYNSKPPIEVIGNCRNKYGLDRNKYTNYIVTNPNFYKILTIIMDHIMKHGGKTLMYIGTIEAMEIVYNWIITNYPQFAYNICMLNGYTEDKNIVNSNMIILSTTKSAGAAVDIKHLKRTVVLAEVFKSEVIARQSLGRTRDNNTEYIEVVDKGFKMIVNWFNYKKPVFSKYALSCKVINLTDRQLNEYYNNILAKIALYTSPPVYNYQPKVKILQYPKRQMLRRLK